MKRVMAMPDIKERFDNFGFTLSPTTPEQHEKNLRADIESFTKVGRQIGLITK
jgi:tripartite-type tricarboxylate transporter receptor subunit TctC